MTTLFYNNITIQLNKGDRIDFTNPKGVTVFTKESNPNDIFNSLFNYNDKPEYISDTIQGLKYGNVAQQVREKFQRVGDTGWISAHRKNTIYNAFSVKSMSAKITKSLGDNYYVERVS